MNRQSRALLTIALLAAILVPVWYARRSTPPAPAGSAPAEDTRPARGGTVTASARSEPRSFNRTVDRGYPTEIFTVLTQGKLARINRATQELEPWLAEKWTTSADGLTHTLTLRDGVTWSDGTPFTAADVLFSFEAAYDKSSVIGSSMLIGGKPISVTSPDPRTVVLTFPEPFTPGLRLLDNMTVLPKHKLEGALRDGSFAKAWSAATPVADLVGLGPFVLTRYEPGQRLVYDRNPQFWRKDDRGQQLPYLDRLVIEIVPEQDAEIVRLQSGQIDFTQQQLRATDLAPMRTLETQGKMRLFDLGVSPDPDHFVFNLRPARWAKDPRGAWLPRKEFRQAISHAVDREAFANTVFLGEAVPIHGPVTPGNKHWFWPDIPRYQFSLDRAKALLEGLGLKNRDGDEWLEDERGTEARFTVQTFRGSSALERSAAVLRDDLRAVGIAVDVVSLEPNTTIQNVIKGEFEAALVAFQASDQDPAVNKDFWVSSGSAHFWNPEQKAPATGWERQIDELMAKQARTADDPERKRLFNEVQKIFAENLPILYFASPRFYVAISPRVGNATPGIIRPQVLWSADTLAVRPPS